MRGKEMEMRRGRGEIGRKLTAINRKVYRGGKYRMYM